jgi:hypothetical protein
MIARPHNIAQGDPTGERAFPSSPVHPPSTERRQTSDMLTMATSYCVALGLFGWQRDLRWGLVQSHPAMRISIEAAFADIRDRALRLTSAEQAARSSVEAWVRWLAIREAQPQHDDDARAMRTAVWAGAWTGHSWKSLENLRGRMVWPRQRAERDASLSLASWLESRVLECTTNTEGDV